MKRYERKFKEQLTQDMIDWFNERTYKHIELVKKYGKLISQNKNIMDKIDGIVFKNEINNHDNSKLVEPEKTPYIYISWDYRCKDLKIDYKIPEDIIEKTNQATNIHVCNNKHHPEYWMKNKNLDVINRSDRDQPNDTIIDCTNMPLTYIATMCADWMAMSEEKGNSPYDWAKKNVNIRWKFDNKQELFIYEVLDSIWNS